MSGTLTKSSIVNFIYERSRRNRTEIQGQIEALLDIMKTAIKKDSFVLMSGFGKFEAYAKHARKGRNPATGSALTLPPRKVVVFRLSRKLKAEINGEDE